jgi:hypothetical protein
MEAYPGLTWACGVDGRLVKKSRQPFQEAEAGASQRNAALGGFAEEMASAEPMLLEI